MIPAQTVAGKWQQARRVASEFTNRVIVLYVPLGAQGGRVIRRASDAWDGEPSIVLAALIK